MPVVAHYRTTHPQVSLYLRTGHTEQLVRELADGLLQLAVVTWSYAATADIVPIVHLREPLIGVVAPAHPLARGRPVSVDTFIRASAPFYHEGWGTPEDARIAHIMQETQPVLSISAELVRLLVIRGMGATLLPCGMAADDLAAGRLIEVPLVDGTALVRELALVRHAGANALPAATEMFAAAVSAAARTMMAP